MTHLAYALENGHCERPGVDVTTDISNVTCPRCLTVIGFYRSSLACCIDYGFGKMNDVTKRNFRDGIIPQARIVANDTEKMLLDAIDRLIRD